MKKKNHSHLFQKVTRLMLAWSRFVRVSSILSSVLNSPHIVQAVGVVSATGMG